MATRARYKRVSVQNKYGMIMATVAVALLLVVVLVRSISLVEKRDSYHNRIDILQSQIEQEEKRREEIAEFETYTTTRKYIEQVAKEKLGLVYPGEIIFKDKSAGK
ncbi:MULTISPECIES: FtsB family cell division protein [unclassified Butyrivibrio]|uniref:FtsB family cell division protein n=1 Tax=unclassified Butyrivibrio TaxID=2639466 RepID=UPI000424331D|nr:MULTISPECIES: septum formation initiator family protein [unclassified Butyrivibrio]